MKTRPGRHRAKGGDRQVTNGCRIKAVLLDDHLDEILLQRLEDLKDILAKNGAVEEPICRDAKGT